MKVGSSNVANEAIKTNFTQKISQEEATSLKEQVRENAEAFAQKSLQLQQGFSKQPDDFMQAYKEFQTFLNDIGYDGKNIAELSKEEAAKLVSEDGFFGIEKTSQRIADFVIKGAGDSAERFRQGREGVLQGYAMAEEMWGGELPEISQKTLQSALETIDKAMYDLGFSILDKEA